MRAPSAGVRGRPDRPEDVDEPEDMDDFEDMDDGDDGDDVVVGGGGRGDVGRGPPAGGTWWRRRG